VPGKGNQVHRLKCMLTSIVITFCCYSTNSYASPKNNSQINEIKAAYLFNLLKFTSWPESDFKKANTLNICIAGNNSVAELLAKGLQGRTAQDKVLQIVYIPKKLDSKAKHSLSTCHFLYLGDITNKQGKQLLNLTKDKATLTTSDLPNFSKNGGMVELKTDTQENRILILINQDSANSTGISFSSKLLRLATII